MRLGDVMRRTITATALAVAATILLATGASLAATPITGRLTTAPPAAEGCYRYVNGVWLTVACATPAYIAAHFPHPELLAGIAAGFKTPDHFTVSVVSAKPVDQQGGSESDSKAGSNAWSLQDNAFFTGTNGKADGVQFTDQTSGGLNGVCVWQVVIPTQSYTSNCATILSGHKVQYVEGTVDAGLLTVAAASGSSWAVAVVVPDLYGLGAGTNWNNSSGSILGFGNGSQAVFSKTEESIGIEVSDCLNDAGFVGYSVFCSGPKLTKLAYVGYSAGPSTYGYQTVETNNLIPVIGKPPKHLPGLLFFSGGYTAQIFYTATTTGKCWTGKAPTCI